MAKTLNQLASQLEKADRAKSKYVCSFQNKEQAREAAKELSKMWTACYTLPDLGSGPQTWSIYSEKPLPESKRLRMGSWASGYFYHKYGEDYLLAGE